MEYRGGGWWALSDGSKVRGRERAAVRERELVGEGWGRNRRAAERMLGALGVGGRLEPVDEARVEMVRALADAVDVDASNAQLWRQYRAAVEDLTTRQEDDVDRDLEEALKAIRGEAEVGDSPEA